MKVFITGGTSGIGYELAKLYQQEGHEVGVTGRNLSKIESEWKDKLIPFEFDVIDRCAFEKALRQFGDVDLLIASAGISVGNKTDIPDFEIGRKIIDTNIIGVHNAVELSLPSMLKNRSGHIVGIGSVSGMIGLPGASFYSASKSYVIKFFESLALTLSKKGINVTVIAPGFIDTDLTRKNPHAMPFIVSAQKAAKKIKNAIDKKKVFYSFPFPMFITVFLLERLPRWLYRALFTSKLFDYRRTDDC